MNQTAMMTKRKTGHASLQQAALFLVCLLAICKAEDLMMGEELAALDEAADAQTASKKLDLVFLIHTSKSVTKQKHNYYKQFLQDIVQNAIIEPTKVRIAVVSYRKKPTLMFNLKKYKTRAAFSDAIKNLKALRSKVGNVAAGLDFIKAKVLTKKAGARQNDAPSVVIVLTDATYKANLKAVQTSAKALKDAGTQIYAVGVGVKDVAQLEGIASMPTDVYNPDTFVNLGKVKDEIVKQIPALMQSDNAGDAEDVDISSKVDLAIVFHLSTDIKPQEIGKYFNPFLVKLLEKANIDGGDVRVALVTFAKNARIVFNLAKFKTSADVFAEINKIDQKVRAKKSSAAKALEEVRTKVFNKKGGDRKDAPDAIILITDEPNSDDQKKFITEAENLRNAGVKIITVGVASTEAHTELRTVVSTPADKNAIYAQSYASTASPSVVESIRNTIRALQEFKEPVLPPTRETVRLPEPPSIGYDLRREENVDVVFAVHFKPKRPRADYDNLQFFLQSLVKNANIDGGKVRFSFFIDGRGSNFDFKTHTTNAAVSNAISKLRPSNFNTVKFDLTGTLRAIRSKTFQPAGGNREGVADAVIIITDTSSGEDSKQIEEEKVLLASAGIQVFSLGVGLNDKAELENVATSVKNVFSFSDYNDLRQQGFTIGNEIRALSASQTEPPKPVIVEKETPPPSSACALSRADLIIIIDSSTSVTEVNFKKVLLFVKDFLSKSDIDTGNVRVGLIVYSTEVYQIFQLKTYRTLRDILRAVDRVPYRFGSTNTVGALDIMRDVMFTPVNGDRADVPNFAIVLTDGVSSVRSNETIPSAKTAQNDGIHIYSIGVGLTDYRELDGIASPPSDKNSFKVPDFDALQTVDDLIFASDCPKKFSMPPPTLRQETPTTQRPTTERPTPPQRITTTTAPTTTTTTQRPTTTTTQRPTTTTTRRTTTTTTRRPTTTTTRRPTTTTTRRTTTTTTPRITTPKRIPQIKENGTDLIFMLDSSVDDRIFGWMKTFVKDFVYQLDIDSGVFRVGGMTFDSRSRADFHLHRYHFQDEIVSNVDKLRNQPNNNRPNVADAFDYVRRSMFISSQGDRLKARNYVVLLTGKATSASRDQTYAAADRLKEVGTGIYTVGFSFGDATEIDRISSEPTEDYRTLVNTEEELREVPGIYKTRIDRAPAPTPKPVVRTTPAPVTRRIQEAPYTGQCRAKGDVIFVLDTSGSVGEDNFELMKNFTYHAIQHLEVDNGFFRIGIITFSDSSRIEFNLNAYSTKQEIYNAIQRIPYVYGYTHTAEALRRVRTEMFTSRNGDRLDVPNMLVVVTDGQSNVNHELTLPEARQIKSAGITIVSVGVGLEDLTELEGLTSPPVNDNLIGVADFEALNKISQVIVSPLCSDVNMCERDPCKNGGSCVDGLKSYLCVCTTGYYGDNCDKSCGPPADVVLILDSSTTVGSSNFNIIKVYAQQMVSEMNVQNCNINIGVIKYSSAAMIQFNLGAYRTEHEILRAIQRVSYTPGRANMAEALRVVRTAMFNNRNGDRQSARNIAFLLTDGSAEINRDITSSEVELTIDAGVRLIPIGISLRDRTEIEYIAESQGLRVVEFESDSKFETMSDQVLEAVYDPADHCARNPCHNGAQCINAPLGFTCVCTEGFAGDLCDKACSGKADVIFVVDSSRYNTGPDFRAIKRFIRNGVKRMAFRSDNFRVAIVEYGTSPRLRLELLEGDNKRTVNSVIGSLRRLNGEPNLESAINLVNNIIVGKNGDREEVPNYLVVITRSVGDLSTVDAINDLKSKGTKVIGIGVDLSGSSHNFLKESVSSPVDQTLITVNAAIDLETNSVDFVNFFCQDKNMCADNPCLNGGICENGEKTFVCRCPSGFAGIDCSRSCQDKADIVFLIDSSGSVGSDNFRRIKEYVQHVVDSFNIGSDATQVGVATFSQSSRAEIYLNSYDSKRKLQAAIGGITYEYGNTNTASGIKLVRSSLFSETKGNRPDVPDYLVVITDGLSNINHDATIPEAEYARKQGIHIFAVGVGIADPWELNGIASKPSETNVFQITGWEALWDISDALIDRTCRDSSVCDGNPCQNDGLCVPGVGTYTCECPQGYLGPNCENSCQSNLDICFIVDASASVGPTNFELMLQYVSSLVKDLTVYGQEHHFAVITYSTEVKTIFGFNRYNTVQQVLDAIQTTPYTSGSTNTAGGLRQAIELFQPGFGERPSAKNVAILLTDGQSNVNYWDTIPAATDLKQNVKVIGVGINLQSTEEIYNISSSRDDVYRVTSFKTLKDIEQDLIEKTCSGED